MIQIYFGAETKLSRLVKVAATICMIQTTGLNGMLV